MKKRPLILVTNDDGMFAPGIKALVEVVRDLGEVLVVAPNSPQSGQGHAITLEEPLRLHKVDLFDGIEAYECSGTPVDCVKLAKHVLTKDRTIDFCVSGVNHGSNASINIIYSGTMSAAMEACLQGIDSVGFSLMDFSMDANFEVLKPYIKSLVVKLMESGMPDSCNLLNVNFPKLPEGKLRGFKVCRQADARWIEEFAEAKDPRGQKYYWLTGRFENNDHGPDTDVAALTQGYISVVPSHHDLTRHEAIAPLNWIEDIS